MYRCRACGFRQNLHVHHIQYRSRLGLDTKENLVTLCNECHDDLHKGRLVIKGNANEELTFRRIK
jgi:5-methylcytosine-specific restriction endonuclease McrA